jgi:Protein of unknown function (DUF3626)
MVLLKSKLSFSLALAKLPTLHLFAVARPEILGLIKSILEEFYTDGIDQVLSAKLDSGGNIVGEFSDRVGARQVKRYQYQITDSEVTYKLLNPSEVSSFSIESFKPLFGVGARAGKKKNCAKSTPCGDSCIAVGKVCRKKPGSAVKAKIAEAKTAIGGGTGAPPLTSLPIAIEHSSQKILKEKRQEVVAEIGEKAALEAEAKLNKIITNAEIFIRCKSNALEKILEDRFKTQFETKRSGGKLSKKARTSAEKNGMNYDADSPVEMRPIYGYWGDKGKHNDDDAANYDYGPVVIRLKHKAKERATFTRQDSLSALAAPPGVRGEYTPFLGVTPALKQNAGVLGQGWEGLKNPLQPNTQVKILEKAETIADLREVFNYTNPIAMQRKVYMEAQIHGQVTPDDIEEIIFTKGTKPSQKAIAIAKSKGIKISVE